MSKGAFVVAAIAVLGAIAGVIALTQNNNLQTSLFQASDLHETTMMDLFNHWKLTYGKVYMSEAQEAAKFQTFKDNYLFIVNWNADPTATSEVGLNQFADMNTAEFSEHISCLNVANASASSPNVFTPTEEQVNALPATVNWATVGAVTPIKNQGQCGSCWAFSATGSLEGANWIFNGKNLQSYSEQQLVDCSTSYGNNGCNGGLMDYAFEYVEANGIELESTYPYTAEDGTCAYSKSSVVFTNTGYTDVATNNEVALATAVAQQPTSVAIEADQSVFQLYTKGVITSSKCGTSLDHGVLAVGYNTQGSQAYWIVKNSWGASWGNQGYVWIAKSSSTSTPGICGIAMMASYATFSS